MTDTISKSPRHMLALAGVLAATVFTGATAILGIQHAPTQSQAATPTSVVQVAPQQHYVEGND